MTITLCLLTWNELEGCKHDVPLIDRRAFDDIFVIDAGSNDGTIEYLQKQKIKVYKQDQKGINAAHIFAAKKCKTEAIIFYHPKGTIPVSDTLGFRKYFDQGYELIIASRMIKGGKNEEDNKALKPRKWAVLLLAYITAVLWRREGHFVKDVLHGVRGVTKSAYRKINPRETGLTIDIEGVIQSYKQKISRIEFPTKEASRNYGRSRFGFLKVGSEVIKLFVEELTRSESEQ